MDRSALVGPARGIVIALVFALPAALAAAEVRYDLGLYSHYVWRGITLTDGPVLQPSVQISHGNGLAFEVWGSADLGDDNGRAFEITETRLALDYGRRFGAVEIGAGLIEYLFPNTPFPGTREVHAWLSADTVVSPRLDLYYDVDEIEGGYARLSLAYERTLSPRWSAGLEGSAAWADADFAIGGRAGLHDAGLEMHVGRTAGVLDLRFTAGWTGSLDSEVLLDQPASFWTGMVVGFRL